MNTIFELDEYATEIRNHVCSRCIERPEGGPPCAPLGKNCGVELHLEKLIDSIHQVHSNRIEPYLNRNRREICEKCQFLHSEICPCPMDYLAILIVEAVEMVDQRHRSREVAESMLRIRSLQGKRTGAEDVRRAFAEAVGTWTGCDWPTKFGKAALDLEGWSAAEAADLAKASQEVGARADWSSAAVWLAQVERYAQQAEKEGALAVAAAEEGNWGKALEHAERAWALEFATGRAVWRGLPLAWQGLHEVVQAAFFGSEPGAISEGAKNESTEG